MSMYDEELQRLHRETERKRQLEVMTADLRAQKGQLTDVVVNQGDVRRFDGDVAADAAHRDADERLFQRRSVIDAVADHADRFARLLKAVDDRQFLLRQAVGVYFVDAGCLGNVPGGVAVVAGQQGRADV